MDRHQPASSEIWRCCVGTQRLDAEKNLAPGRVVETSPGQDGEVRVAKIKTAHGSFVRLVAGFARFFSQFFNSNFRPAYRQHELYPPPFDVIILPLF